MPDDEPRKLEVGTKGSFLNDQELKAALPNLFRPQTYSEQCVRHASYELRLGARVMVSPYKTGGGETLDKFIEADWHEDEKGGEAFLELERNQVALLYTEESFDFPANVLGFVLSRGLLFSKALTPETTYVDPGFGGELYITVRNASDSRVKLYRKMRLARLFAFRLPTAVKEPYVSGQAKGIEQQLSQIPVRESWPKHELPTVPDEDILRAVRDGCSIGDLLDQLVRRRVRDDTVLRIWLLILSLVLVLSILWNPVIVPLSQQAWIKDKVGETAASLFVTVVMAALALVIAWLGSRVLRPVWKWILGKAQ